MWFPTLHSSLMKVTQKKKDGSCNFFKLPSMKWLQRYWWKMEMSSNMVSSTKNVRPFKNLVNFSNHIMIAEIWLRKLKSPKLVYHQNSPMSQLHLMQFTAPMQNLVIFNENNRKIWMGNRSSKWFLLPIISTPQKKYKNNLTSHRSADPLYTLPLSKIWWKSLQNMAG